MRNAQCCSVLSNHKSIRVIFVVGNRIKCKENNIFQADPVILTLTDFQIILWMLFFIIQCMHNVLFALDNINTTTYKHKSATEDGNDDDIWNFIFDSHKIHIQNFYLIFFLFASRSCEAKGKMWEADFWRTEQIFFQKPSSSTYYYYTTSRNIQKQIFILIPSSPQQILLYLKCAIQYTITLYRYLHTHFDFILKSFFLE